jgi:membrane fusion protein (multidrug efflux system)
VVGLSLVGLAGLAALAYGVSYYLDSRHRVSTDDAQVEGALVTISARVPGPVARVLVGDNEEVREEQALIG